MTVQIIDIGSSETSGDGESIRSAFNKINDNFASFRNGYSGSQGSVGYTGSQGDTGYVGSASTEVGYTGSQGDDGLQGITGFTGSQGNIGFTGSRGSTGFTGSNGSVGFTGSIGPQGYTGDMGDQGATGYTGSHGSTGFTGSQGTTGYVGSHGTTGYTGSKGDIGNTGNAGYTGSTGTIGHTGSQGDLGYSGSRGFTGSAGTNGTVGYNGSMGYTGSRGFTGSAGTNGTIGYNGSVGYTGSKGDTGYAGSQGLSGQGLINQNLILNNVAAATSYTAVAVTEWSASYTGTGGQLLVKADIIVWVNGSTGTRNWYLKKNGTTVATGSFFFNSSNVHTTMPTIQYIDTTGSTTAATWSITLGTGLTADVNDRCTITVTEYTASLGTGYTGSKGDTGATGYVGSAGVLTGAIPAWTSAGAITITATTTNPTKGATRTQDNISYRQIGDKEWEIVLTYIQTANTGGNSGSGDYLITLPNGLSFDTTLPSQQIWTGNIGTSTWAHNTYVIPNGNGTITNNTVGGNIFPMVYNATKFRILTLTYGSGIQCWGSGFYSVGGDNPRIQLSFRFTST